jgi:hypothetical protein
MKPMRKKMVARVLMATGGATLLVMGFIACSGSDGQDLVQGFDSGPDTSLPDTSVADTGPKDTGADVAKESGPIYDAGPVVTLDGGDLYEGGVPCVLGGELEEEPNDDTANANTLNPNPLLPEAGKAQSRSTRCGVMFLVGADGGDAGNDSGLVPELEYLTFQLQSTTKSFFVQYGGNVVLKVEVEGHPPVTIPSPDASIPFVKNKPYYIQVKSADGKSQKWRVTLFEDN